MERCHFYWDEERKKEEICFQLLIYFFLLASISPNQKVQIPKSLNFAEKDATLFRQKLH